MLCTYLDMNVFRNCSSSISSRCASVKFQYPCDIMYKFNLCSQKHGDGKPSSEQVPTLFRNCSFSLIRRVWAFRLYQNNDTYQIWVKLSLVYANLQNVLCSRLKTIIMIALVFVCAIFLASFIIISFLVTYLIRRWKWCVIRAMCSLAGGWLPHHIIRQIGNTFLLVYTTETVVKFIFDNERAVVNIITLFWCSFIATNLSNLPKYANYG